MALFHIGSKGKLVLVLVTSHIPLLLGTYVTVNLSDLQGTQ